ncbi:hypothetical protein [Streptomyces ficellus]|uniref:Uncharacterized protein n=1 Tax=Streptomyces ficellus TaxID=1977088 RepID=A0A6I6FEJ0_9ACTN|nr:hypothetical protein [Streptomyces ficellus]QGV79447.1 hypothetical protein EIZ62_15230 [Streptomyces ficellus]
MSGARHRRPYNAGPGRGRSDRSSRLALTFLAFAGLVGPAWSLRVHVDPSLGPTGHPAVMATPDSSPQLLAADR